MSKNLSENEIDDILNRFVQGMASRHEYQLVIAWFESLNDKQKKDLDENLRLAIEEKMWMNLQSRVQMSGSLNQSGRSTTMWLSLSLAASLLIFISFFVFINKGPSSQQPSDSKDFANLREANNGAESPRDITLIDGTKITLKSGASISHNDFAKERKRIVYLQGEAFFDVAHDEDRPFEVLTGNIVTTVLGTSFTIHAPSTNDKITVAVFRGKVSVAKQSTLTQKVVLTPNQQAVFDPFNETLTATLLENPVPVVKEKAGKRIFREEPVINILKEIESIYGIDIQYDEAQFSECRVTTSFSKETLFEKLDILTAAINATYTIEDTVIKIKGNGCH